MKKTNISLAAVLASAAICLAGCASTPASSSEPQQNLPPASKSVTRENIDWKGAAVNAEIPDWVVDAIASDYAALESGTLSQKLKGKYYVIVEGDRNRNDQKSTKDLKLLESSVNAQYMVQIAQTLNNGVDQRFSGVLSANEDTQKQLTATATQATFTGFQNVGDYWILQRITDSKKNTATDTYRVVQIYACDKDLWEQQAAAYIKKLGMESDSEDLKKAGEMADNIAAGLKPSKTPVYYFTEE